MTEQKTYEETLRELDNMDPREVVRLAANKIGQYKKQSERLARENAGLKTDNERLNNLVAEFSSQKEQTAAEADRIISEARASASEIEAAALRYRDEAHNLLREADATAERRIANASAEAESILASRLSSVEKDIHSLEERRENTKKEVMIFYNNVLASFDSMIEETNLQMSSYKDVRQMVAEQALEIETESFPVFNIGDYVSVSAPDDEGSSVAEDTIYDEYPDFDSLRDLLDEAEPAIPAAEPAVPAAIPVAETAAPEPEAVSAPVPEPAPAVATPVAEVPVTAPVVEAPAVEVPAAPVVEAQAPAAPVVDVPSPADEAAPATNWGDMLDSTMDKDLDEDEMFSDAEEISHDIQDTKFFTDSFPPVNVAAVDDFDEDDDLSDFNFDDAEPPKGDAEDEFEDEDDEFAFDDLMDDIEETTSPLRIPERPEHAMPANKSAWL